MCFNSEGVAISPPHGQLAGVVVTLKKNERETNCVAT